MVLQVKQFATDSNPLTLAAEINVVQYEESTIELGQSGSHDLSQSLELEKRWCMV